MSPIVAAILLIARARTAAAHHSGFLALLMHLGLVGVFLVSIVDSSFVPLPIPGITDVMIVVLAAHHDHWPLLVALATAGSALGGYLSYQVGHTGGMAFLEKRVPPRIFERVCGWMEHHAILSVALPAILPPPMPLSPFVLAAGALNMSRRKFLTTFTISRGLRHLVAAWLGLRYGRQVLGIWNRFSDRWAATILIVLWSVILIACGIAFYRLYKTSRSLRDKHEAEPAGSASSSH
ncbi:MAG TPA: VTT domain-containing protein [Granulicella sp.]